MARPLYTPEIAKLRSVIRNGFRIESHGDLDYVFADHSRSAVQSHIHYLDVIAKAYLKFTGSEIQPDYLSELSEAMKGHILKWQDTKQAISHNG